MQDVSGQDLIATFTAFSAWAFVSSIRANIPDRADLPLLVASGGGVRNGTLVKMVREQLRARPELIFSGDLGSPAQCKEAIKFAVLAFATRNGLANNIPSASGAAPFTIMGKTVVQVTLASQRFRGTPADLSGKAVTG